MKVIMISGESGVGKSYFANLILNKIKLKESNNKAIILPFASFLKVFSNEFLYMSFDKDKEMLSILKCFLTDLIDKVSEDNKIIIDKYKLSIKNKMITKSEFFIYIYSLMNKVIDYLNINYSNDNIINKSNLYINENDNFLSNILYYSYKNDDVRTFYQYFGTEYIRKLIDENFHIKMLLIMINKAKENYDYIIIDDLRFPNEKMFMRNIFKENVIHIHICNKNNVFNNNEWYKKHESERYNPILFESADFCFVKYN